MENLETVEQESRNELVLEMQAEVFLLEGRKWAKILAVIGFVGLGLGVLIAIGMFVASGFIGDVAPFPVAGFGFFYLLMIGVYFFPIYYLLQFSNKAKEALTTRNTQSLTESMRYLKGHYKFIGIATIVMFALYPIMMLFMVGLGVGQSFASQGF